MTQRNRVAEIAEMKARGQRGGTLLSYEIASLLHSWQQDHKTHESVADYFPIRAITLLEVFSRAWIADLVDHGAPYAERAVEISKGLKFDHDVVSAIQGSKITLGELVAHSVSLNSLEQVAYCLETLLADKFIQSNWPETQEKERNRILASLSRLFEVRHILCHECPNVSPYGLDEVEPFLSSASKFSDRVSAQLNTELFGYPGISGYEMRARASNSFEANDAELSKDVATIRASCDSTRKRLLDRAQRAWLKFRIAQASFRGDFYRGGTFQPTAGTIEMDTLTLDRLRQVRRDLIDLKDV